MQTRAGMIVTFLAVLEMIRMKRVRVFQQGGLGPIRVYRREQPAEAPFASSASISPDLKVQGSDAFEARSPKSEA